MEHPLSIPNLVENQTLRALDFTIRLFTTLKVRGRCRRVLLKAILDCFALFVRLDTFKYKTDPLTTHSDTRPHWTSSIGPRLRRSNQSDSERRAYGRKELDEY